MANNPAEQPPPGRRRSPYCERPPQHGLRALLTSRSDARLLTSGRREACEACRERAERAFLGKVAADTYAGRATARRSNPRDRATTGEGLTAVHLPAL
jgi:hypothetical protein